MEKTVLSDWTGLLPGILRGLSQVIVIDHRAGRQLRTSLLHFVLAKIARQVAERRSIVLRSCPGRKHYASNNQTHDGESKMHGFSRGERTAVHKQSLGEIEGKEVTGGTRRC